MAGSEIYDEIYTIDPNTNEKIILKTKNQTQPPKPKTQVNAPVNEAYMIDPQTGQKINLENYDNITSSIDPSYAYQRSQENNNQNATPIIENYNINATTIFPQRGISQEYQDKNKEMDPNKSVSLLTVSSLEYSFKLNFASIPFFFL